MEIEQLKLILETVNNTTEGAKDIAICYLVIEALKPIIGFLIFITGATLLYKGVMKATRFNQLEDEMRYQFKKIGEALNIHINYRNPTDENTSNIIHEIRKLKKQ